MTSDDPIFIGGVAHSGKTQLRIVMGAHPDVSLTRRTYAWDRFYGRFGDLADPRNLERCLAAMLADPRIAVLEPDGERIGRALADGSPSYARLFGVVHAQYAERHGKRRWGEQVKFVERFADPIFSAFPSARMIHMVRDPRTPVARRPGRRRPGAVGWEVAAWLRSADLADRNVRRYPGRYVVVRYESFAADPGRTIDLVARFVGEDVVPPMQEALSTLSFDDAGEGGAKRRRWSARTTEAAFVERYAGRAMTSLGYVDPRTTLAPGELLAFHAFGRPLNRLSMAAWRALRGDHLSVVEA